MQVVFVMQAVLVVTIAIALSGALLAWRERPEPGSIPLTAFLVGACWWSATLLFKLEATTLSRKVFWVDVSWLGVALIPVAWMFFGLAYTGYSEYIKPEYVAVASVVPAITVVLGVTNEFHGFVYSGSTLIQGASGVVLSRPPGPWFWVAAGYTYVLGLIGAAPLVRFVTSEVETFRGQSLALLVGLVTPWLTNLLFLAGRLPTGGIDPTPIAFSVSAIAFLGAVTQFRLFDTSPAPIRSARRRAFDRMEAGIIVLDRRDNVVDLNWRAVTALASISDDPYGRNIAELHDQFGTLLDHPSQSGTVVFGGDDRTTYDVSVAELTDTHGRTMGRIVTLQDISEYVRQQQRLEVLNRVFRHNIRTNSQALIGHVDYLAEHDSEAVAQQAHETVMDISEFGDKIRTVLDVFERSREETRPVRLDRVLSGVLDTVGAEYPDVTVHTSSLDEVVHVDSIAHGVFSNVVENAAEHNTSDDPTVWVEPSVDVARGVVTVVVRDNGPGIPRQELALLREGSETPLNHGSGLGLALVVWGTDIIGGQVDIQDGDPAGTVVSVELPVLSTA